jgi:hypothetical protein
MGNGLIGSRNYLANKAHTGDTMKAKFLLLLLISHLSVGVLGFAIGIYALPILIAPTAPTEFEITEVSAQKKYSGVFIKDLKDSDRFHWGEGDVSIGSEFITLMGKLAPGPDYKLYLSPEFVETEVNFNRLKSTMVQVGDVKTFENFVVKIPANIDPSHYTTVIIWCETFGEFITAAAYR